MDLFDYMRENTIKQESPLASRLRPQLNVSEGGSAKALLDKVLEENISYQENKKSIDGTGEIESTPDTEAGENENVQSDDY